MGIYATLWVSDKVLHRPVELAAYYRTLAKTQLVLPIPKPRFVIIGDRRAYEGMATLKYIDAHYDAGLRTRGKSLVLVRRIRLE